MCLKQQMVCYYATTVHPVKHLIWSHRWVQTFNRKTCSNYTGWERSRDLLCYSDSTQNM